MITPTLTSATETSSIAKTVRTRASNLTSPRHAGFTLLELLVVISIIAVLASMLLPAVGGIKARADSVSCAANLRAVGMAVQGYLQDHSFIYPEIQTDPNNPVYPAGYGNPQTMVQAFGQYGVTDKVMQCPADIKTPNGGSYKAYGTSYDWRPTLDDENGSNPLIYGMRRGFGGGAQTSGSAPAAFSPKLSKVRQCFDDTQIHFGHMNALYADGHVVYFSAPNGGGNGR